MADPRTRPSLAELRRQAEQRLSRVIEQSVPSLQPENRAALLHELQVHQIELEMQCHELRLAQAELAESRDTYRELYESIPVGYVTLDRDGRIYDVNPTATVLLRWDPQSHPIRNFSLFFSGQNLDRFTLFCRHIVFEQTGETGEFELTRPDGSSFFAALQAAPVKTGEGKGERLRLTFKDITQRKEADETLRRQQAELRELTQLLMTAQEEERKRIAREIHDDHCQRVTTLILDVKMLTRLCEKQSPDVVSRLTMIGQKLSALLKDFRTLSHDLLPRDLGDVSLVGPVRDLVREFTGKAGFEIDFVEREVPVNIPPDIMTTVFRLLQESLSNIVKHAKAKRVAVTLEGTATGIELIVVDDGVGWNSAQDQNAQKGMGLVGMRERVRPLGGTVKIQSQQDRGTTVVFSIPLPESK